MPSQSAAATLLFCYHGGRHERGWGTGRERMKGGKWWRSKVKEGWFEGFRGIRFYKVCRVLLCKARELYLKGKGCKELTETFKGGIAGSKYNQRKN